MSFKEVAGRKVKTMVGDINYVTDTFAVVGDKEFHIGGYYPTQNPYACPSHEKASLFARKMQFLNSDGGFIKFYCHAGADIKTPLEFIDWVKEINDNFGKNYDCAIKKYGNKWEFDGNLERISCAFSFRIFSEELANQIKDKLQDSSYFKNISFE